MGIVARLLGVVLLLAAIFWTKVSKKYIRVSGSIMQATILQYVFVPLITGLGLVITGKFAILVIGIIVWIFAPVPGIGQILFLAYPLVSGWYFGVYGAENLLPASRWYGYIGGVFGAVMIYFACGLVHSVVTGPDKLSKKVLNKIMTLEKTISIDPNDAGTHHELGTAYRRVGRLQDAIKSHKEAIRLNPDYAEAYYDLGVAYGNLHRRVEEMEAYKEALRIKPDFKEAHYNLGLSYILLFENKELALEEYMMLKNIDKGLSRSLLRIIKKYST